MEDAIAEAERLSQREHFEAIVRRYQGPLLRYARCSLGPDDAQDVVQETFLRLHKVMRKNNLKDIVSVAAVSSLWPMVATVARPVAYAAASTVASVQSRALNRRSTLILYSPSSVTH